MFGFVYALNGKCSLPFAFSVKKYTVLECVSVPSGVSDYHQRCPRDFFLQRIMSLLKREGILYLKSIMFEPASLFLNAGGGI